MRVRRVFPLVLGTSLICTLATSAGAAPLTLVSYSSADAQLFDQSLSSESQVIDLAPLDIRADYGDLGVLVTAKETVATGAWRDEWTVIGGSGTGTLTIGWELDGTLTALRDDGADDNPRITYAELFGESAVFNSGTVVFTQTQSAIGTGTVNTSGSFVVAFEYGTTFGAGFRLTGFIGDDAPGGTVDFLNSGIITSVILPAGATLLTATDTVYPLQTLNAVPEPATLLLLGSGLGAMTARRWRRRGRAHA